MHIKQFLLNSIALSIVLGLTACGGGSGSSNTGSGNTSNNASKDSSTSGTITAFGSIYVNGVEYDTDNAAVYIEDEAANESDLRVGMNVVVVKSRPGVADKVYFDDNLEGIVIANNITAGNTTGTLNIMGQTVTIDNDTIFESEVAAITTYAQISAGNIVEVSGGANGNGNVTATRLEVKSVDLAIYLSTHPSGIELKGLVSNHNVTKQTFDIGGMTITYAGAVLKDLPNGISNGLYLEVKSIQGLNVLNQLVASKIELESDNSIPNGNEGDEYEEEGDITAMSDTSITVNNRIFQLNDATKYEEGTKNSLVMGARVEVVGAFDNNGQLIATKVAIEDQAVTIELRGAIATITVTGTNTGTITLIDGSVILVTNNTIMHDSRNVGVMPDTSFNLTALAQGNYIEARVVNNSDGTYTAIRLDRENPPT